MRPININKKPMKTPNLLLAATSFLILSSCEPDDNSDGAPELNENLKQIAFNFRSESYIVVEDGTADYMGQFDHKVLLDDIFEAIYAGKIQAFDFMDDPLTIEEVQYKQSHTDTTLLENFETGELESVVITEELNPDDVVKVFMVEDWFLDKETFKMEKRVVSMTLCTLKLDLEGDSIGVEILFKIYLDGKGPQREG